MHNINVQKNTTLKHLQRGGEARPYLDLMVWDLSRLGWIEEVPSDLLEADLLKHTIEEHFQEDKHVIVLLSDALHPSDINLILNLVDTGRLSRNFW